MRLAAAALLFLACSSALAAGGKGTEQGYEDRLETWGLEQVDRQRVAPVDAEGKRIEEILIVSENVVAPSDPYPEIVNVLHVRTRERIIRRELTLEVGSPFTAEAAAETERNLRRIFILAVARVVPVKGHEGGVGVVVVTKDRWSLRFNSEFNFVGPLLQYLRLRPTEQNLLGLNQQLTLDFLMRLDTVGLGQQYRNPRLFGEQLLFSEWAMLVLNKRTLAPEGTDGFVVLGRPLYTLDSTWGWSGEGAWSLKRRRIFRGASVWQLPYPTAEAPESRVPYVYDQRDVLWNGWYTRSLGRAFKVNVSGGIGGFHRRYVPAASSNLDEAQSAWLVENHLPRSETASFVAAKLQAFRADYRVLRDLDSFALSEDLQLGPSLLAMGRWADRFLFSPERFVELGLSLRYRQVWGQNVVAVSVAGAARGVLDGAQGWVNRRLAAELINYSPPVEGGRFVFRALWDLRWDDLDHRKVLLGGGNGLRGAAPESLSGRNLALFNLEYRTRPVEWQTLFIGFVLFYDAGSAFDEQPSFTHTTGLGIRILVPQWNQETIRIDLGLVFGQRPLSLGDSLSGSFGQINDYRPDLFERPLD